MLKRLQLLFVLVFGMMISTMAQVGSGTLKGSIVDETTGEPLPFVSVQIFSGDRMVGGASSDFDGKFQVSNIPPGNYDVAYSFMGYQSKKVTGVIINNNKITFQDNVKMSESSLTMDEFVVEEYAVPLIDKDGGASGGTVTKEAIAKMPTRSVSGVAATVGGVAESEGGGLSVRGERLGSNLYFLDGIKLRGQINLPKDAIQEVQVLTGGLPASYGDITGGVISITTAGVTSQFLGGVEFISSGFRVNDEVYGLDNYGYNLAEGSISGPLLRKKDSLGNKKEPLIGFLLVANYNHNVDSRPLFGGTYKIKDEWRQELEESPLILSNDRVIYLAQETNESNIDAIKTRDNVQNWNTSGVLKLDFNTGKNSMLTVSGSGQYSDGMLGGYSGSLFNSPNFGVQQTFEWRSSVRFNQKFPVINPEKGSKFKGASYSVMLDYMQGGGKVYDPKHGDDIFGYGYVGKFETFRRRSYDYDANENVFKQNGWADTLVVFTPSDVNTGLSSQTEQYFNLFDDPAGRYNNLVQIQLNNGLLNGTVPQNVYNIWTNYGVNYNQNAKSQNNQFRATASGSVNYGDHRLTVGFEYEQRKDLYHTVGGVNGSSNGPIQIWTMMRQQVNKHIAELDPNSGTVFNDGTSTYINYDRLQADIETANNTGNPYERIEQATIDYNLRLKLGLDPLGTDFIDVDALDPSMFSIDMFSADELLSNGNSFVDYRGYSYFGDVNTKRYSLDDFFTLQNDLGDFERPVNAYEPIYMAGYIMDKFSLDDIIFNVGVRVDRFDANQPVLKDKYLLVNAHTAQDVRDGLTSFTSELIPESIGDDYVVYVDDIDNPSTINGFRNGDDWYDAKGEFVNNPSVVRGANGIAPLVEDQNELNGKRIQSGAAFTDYKPQINVMPRIAFSFPISDEAAFSAHYDILTQRPYNNIFNPFNYFYMVDNPTRIITNPDLKAEKTIDYEVAFQQVVTKSSSIKISAFYREQRDKIQIVNVTEAFPNTYTTYGNIDFGTVKGFTFSYDLRRTKNISLRMSYTLQFADGTGSGPNDGLNLAAAGQPNLRTIFPYSYDQRHTINGVFDFRYGSGKDYNGPTINGKQLLKNFGINLTGNLSSGTPFSRREDPGPQALISGNQVGPLTGTKNGSRLPWRTRVNLQVDKDFEISSKNEDKKKVYLLNVYVWVTNLFNSQNITGLYSATASPSDDGYLSSEKYKTQIEEQQNVDSYRYLYGLKVNNPYNFGQPTTIRLGVKFGF